MKLIIVDDEVWVCKLIRKIINWEELDIKIVGEANNGYTAFNIILDKKPDIVITDIRMPGLDGISLINKVQEAKIDTNFIIISGYQDFEYAQKALRYGVEDYLLKPIKKEQLYKTVKSLINKLLKDKTNRLKEIELKEKLSTSIDKLKERALNNIIFENSITVTDYKKLNKNFNYKFKEGVFQVFIYKIDNKFNNKIDNSFKKMMINKIFNIIKSYIDNSIHEFVLLEKNNQVILLLNYSSEDIKQIDKLTTNIFLKLKNNAEISSHFYITLGIGTVENNIDSVNISYTQANSCIKMRIFKGVGKVLRYDNSDYKDIKFSDIISIENEMQFSNIVKILDKERVENWLKTIFDNIEQKNDIDPCVIFEVCYEIISILYRVMIRSGFHIEENIEMKDNVIDNIENCKDLKEIKEYIYEFIIKVFDYYENNNKEKSTKIIDKAKSYISMNYNKDISLSDVAEKVYLNPVYFSQLFKKEVGVSFSDYITNYRIEIAKQYLQDIKYKINDVAHMVGYNDPKHFSKLFKKNVGISPNQYKKINNI